MTTATAARGQRRPLIIRLVLAAVAVLGIGAALTSAAWTDNVFFGADASAGSFNLQGSADSKTFDEHDSEDKAAVILPTDAFEGLSPGKKVTTSIWVRNAGTVDAVLEAPEVKLDGKVFDPPEPATVEVTQVGGGAVAGHELAAGDTIELSVTLTTPDWTGDTHAGHTGTVLIRIGGASD